MRTPLYLLPVVVAALVGCESDSSGPVPTPNEAGVVEVDASSNSDFTYFSLADGAVVTVSDPTTSTEWDLALRRFEVRLNGGVSGSKGVAGHNLKNNAVATADEVLAFTPDNQKPAFDAIGEAAIPASSSFVTDALEPNPLGWLAFGPQGPVANPASAWKVRTAAGAYALVRATDMTIGGSTPQTAELATVTLEWRYQPAGGALGAAQQATIDLSSGTTALDLATGTLVAPGGCNWDVGASPDFSLTVNDACSAGTFPLDAVASLDDVAEADDAPQYGAFLAGLTGAIPFSSSLDDPESPFLYNLAGDNRLSPTFNIYLVQVGDAVYKVELTGYYSATGVSGHPTIRYARIK